MNKRNDVAAAPCARHCSTALIAKEAVDDLFCIGRSNEARRLVIEQVNGKDGGGYCREAVESHFVSAIERALTCNGSPADPLRRWVVAWRYSDGSASGVLPWMFDDRERAKMESILEELGTEKDYSFVEVSQ